MCSVCVCNVCVTYIVCMCYVCVVYVVCIWDLMSVCCVFGVCWYICGESVCGRSLLCMYMVSVWGFEGVL